MGTLLLTGIVMGSGYALWNVAILRGNMLLLATLSYFTAGYLNLIFIADFRGGPRVKFLAGSDHGDIRFADLLVGDSRVEFINRGGA